MYKKSHLIRQVSFDRNLQPIFTQRKAQPKISFVAVIWVVDNQITIGHETTQLIDEGLPGVLGNKGTLAKYRREQGNISQFLGTGTKFEKLQYENILRECGNMGT